MLLYEITGLTFSPISHCLRSAINDLAYRRLTTQGIALIGDVYAQYISSMYTMVVMMKKKKTDVKDNVDEVCEDLKKVCSYIFECHY